MSKISLSVKYNINELKYIYNFDMKILLKEHYFDVMG